MPDTPKTPSPSAPKTISAVEFFSGIGGFAEACKNLPIGVVSAFDQSDDANEVYRANFGLSPVNRNLDSISAHQIPDADIWWTSPPCKPYTVRGKQLDDRDNRSLSLRNLVALIPAKLPSALFVENVVAFATSHMRQMLIGALADNGYVWTEQFLCPTQFGIPMKRPRYFLSARRTTDQHRCNEQSPVQLKAQSQGQLRLFTSSTNAPTKSLTSFIDQEQSICSSYNRAELLIDAACLKRYAEGFNIISADDENAIAICFTSGYAKSVKASGSLYKTKEGTVRRFSPEEILRLFGFSPEFSFPDDMSLETRWRLIGNSIAVCCVTHVLTNFVAASATVDTR